MKKLVAICILIGLIMPLSPTAAPSGAATDTFDADWFREGIMYEVFVRSFRDSDGDGIGDLQGVIDGLDYIQRLGANIIWLMPIHPSPSYHGYDVSDYYAINPDYGTPEDMQALIQAAHERGMYVILDYVANHTSHEHEFFQDAFGNPDSPYSDFYKWVDDDQTHYRSFAGVQSMPEVNYASQQARQYMLDVARYWLDPNGDGDPSDGVDGFRCDVAIGPPLDFWAEVHQAMLEVNPQSVLLGEVWLRSSLQLQEYLDGQTFNALFDFPTFHALVADHDTNGDGAVSGQTSFEFVELALKGALALYPEDAHLVRFINNHDTNRFMSEVDGDWERARAGVAWLLTAPGTPMIYYGEEIGMFGEKGDSGFYDEYRREPMDWFRTGRGPYMASWFKPGDRFNLSNDGVSVEEQDDDPASLLNHYRALGIFRQQTPALRGGFGTLELSAEGADLYAVWRGDLAGDFVLVVINFTQEAITATLTGENLPVTDLNSLQVAFSQGYTADGLTVSLDPVGYAILTNTRPPADQE